MVPESSRTFHLNTVMTSRNIFSLSPHTLDHSSIEHSRTTHCIYAPHTTHRELQTVTVKLQSQSELS